MSEGTRRQAPASAAVRLSVRALVAFSVFPPDILPFSSALMEEGRQAHLGRQEKSGARRELGLKYRGRRMGIEVDISGRMDLYDNSINPPLIEEIKLSPGVPPEEAKREHLDQALCYGYMLCLRDSISEVSVRVSYADLSGELTAQFERVYGMSELETLFFELLDKYIIWHKRMERHRARRDKSIEALPFPYPAYRGGQREMAGQVYTAILRRRRLYAVMPTGTGKSAAVLYPALKALGLGHTEQIYCLTARTTARRAMEQEFLRMRAHGLKLKALTLNAREKICPMAEVRCDPDYCPRARGHYLRQEQGLLAAMKAPCWDTEAVIKIADRHELCPFEFSLALCELADAVVCDYNYAFDPRVRIKRIFENPGDLTLLVDEAHNLPDRLRETLSGGLSGAMLAEFRREAGKRFGRKHPVYKQAAKLLLALRELEEKEPALKSLYLLADELLGLFRQYPEAAGDGSLSRELLGFYDALGRQLAEPAQYRLLIRREGREQAIRLLCLDFTPYLKKATEKLCGFVCYSATLSPLPQMSKLLGGDEEDACFELPSPFPPEHLLCLHVPLNTRYQQRESTAAAVAAAVRAMYMGKAGKYAVFFPSYLYMGMVAEQLSDLPLMVQEAGMDEEKRADFIGAFTRDEQPLLALCVLGGIFAEGIDLPGRALIGVCVVGVGLPQIGPEREAIREQAESSGHKGFDIAYRYPGMHKVLQAAGRLIRSDSDRGVLLLCDDRYGQPGYFNLLPPHYRVIRARGGEIEGHIKEFWDREQS